MKMEVDSNKCLGGLIVLMLMGVGWFIIQVWETQQDLVPKVEKAMYWIEQESKKQKNLEED